MLIARVSQQMLIEFLILTKIVYYDNLPTDGNKVSFTASFIGSK